MEHIQIASESVRCANDASCHWTTSPLLHFFVIKALNLAFFGLSSNFIYFKGYFFVMSEKKADVPGEGNDTKKEAGETPRGFGLEERIEVLSEDPDTDIFDEVISGKKRPSKKVEIPAVEEKIIESKPAKGLSAKQKTVKKAFVKKSKKLESHSIVEKPAGVESIEGEQAKNPVDEPEPTGDLAVEKGESDSEELGEGDEEDGDEEIDLEHEIGSREEGATVDGESRRRERYTAMSITAKRRMVLSIWVIPRAARYSGK